MIRVLLVDDSEVTLQVLEMIFEKETDIFVIGKSRSGAEAIAMTARLSPDIITMDINMPGMDGFITTRKIMENTPVPIIIVSGIDNLDEIRASFKAVEAGALAIYQKPPPIQDPAFGPAAEELVLAIRTYSEVRVIRRRNHRHIHEDVIPETLQIPDNSNQDIRVVVIGASTGGPQVVQDILMNLPTGFSLPMVLVQHMSPGFIEGMAIWLSESTGYKTKIPSEGELLQPGILYIAPDGKHTGITKDNRICFSHDKPEHNLRPSVSYLFRSAACNFEGSVVGILLTGMGSDGAEELLLIRQKGGLTVIQDRESAYVYGMPGAAETIRAAMYSFPPKRIASFLTSLSRELHDDR